VWLYKFKNKILNVSEQSLLSRKGAENPWNYTDFKIWNKLAPPWRPSNKDISNYKTVISQFKPKETLVLGSTPEIRDLLCSLKTKVSLVDSSLSMVEQMEKLMKKKNSKEKWLIDDWQKVDISKGSFDLIIGDLVLRLIPYKKQERFLRKINYLLKRGGVFVTRVHYVNEQLQFIKPEKILRDVFMLYKRKKISLKEAQGLIVLRFYDKFADFDQHVINEDHVYSCLESFLKKTSPKNKKIIRQALDIWRKGAFSYTQLREKEVENKLKKYFNIAGLSVANDYYEAQFHPIYLLKKR